MTDKLTAGGKAFGDNTGIDIPDGVEHTLKKKYKEAVIELASPQFADLKKEAEKLHFPKDMIKKLFAQALGPHNFIGLSPKDTQDLMDELIEHFIKD